MSISSCTIAVDCDNAATLAQFWSAVLGEPFAAGSSEEFAAFEPSAAGPGLIFCKVPGPKTSKTARAARGRAVCGLGLCSSKIMVSERSARTGLSRLAPTDTTCQ